jgi:hypothetical protein
MDALDIIGDVHGCASKLRQLLDRLGYTESAGGAYRHPGRRVTFVGDLIDRGAEQREVLALVKAMHDAGSADVVMGNHEFNAIAYATPDPEASGTFLRDNDNVDNQRQHSEFLKLDPPERQEYLTWFKTLPLWLDYGHVRVVHACWHEQSIRDVETLCGGNRLTDAHFAAAARDGQDNRLFQAVEILLKGPEISLTDLGHERFKDPGGKVRNKARAMWWRSEATTLRELADMRVTTTESGDPYPQLPAHELDSGQRSFVYTDRIPLFYGHYWLSWEKRAQAFTTYTACVDFSAGVGGPLVAYRWNGERTIALENYVPHDPQLVAHGA